jgi:hypothetical protein
LLIAEAAVAREIVLIWSRQHGPEFADATSTLVTLQHAFTAGKRHIHHRHRFRPPRTRFVGLL